MNTPVSTDEIKDLLAKANAPEPSNQRMLARMMLAGIRATTESSAKAAAAQWK
jgi:hypothetical protein